MISVELQDVVEQAALNAVLMDVENILFNGQNAAKVTMEQLSDIMGPHACTDNR